MNNGSSMMIRYAGPEKLYPGPYQPSHTFVDRYAGPERPTAQPPRDEFMVRYAGPEMLHPGSYQPYRPEMLYPVPYQPYRPESGVYRYAGQERPVAQLPRDEFMARYAGPEKLSR